MEAVRWHAFIGREMGVTQDERVMTVATLNAASNFVEVHQTEEAAAAALAVEIAARGVSETKGNVLGRIQGPPWIHRRGWHCTRAQSSCGWDQRCV